MRPKQILKFAFTGILGTALSLSISGQKLQPHGDHHHHEPDHSSYCYHVEDPDDGAAETATCQSNNLNNNIDRYKLQERFIPSVTQPIKTLRINIHCVTTASSSNMFGNNQTHIDFLNTMVDKVNDLYKDIVVPTVPQTCVCGTECYIADSRIRVELMGIYFDHTTSSSINISSGLSQFGVNTDTELNIFIKPNPPGSGKYGGAAYGPSETNLTKNGGIELNNYYSYYQYWLNHPTDPLSSNSIALNEANNLAHEIGHNLGFCHTYSGTFCDESTNPASRDYLDDFFGTGAPTCPFVPMPVPEWCDYGPGDDCSLNMMGGRKPDTQREMTPKQMGRIHRNSMLTSIRKCFDPFSQHLIDHEITGTETWEFSIRMYGDIRVKKGAKLTIKCEVLMPPNSEIFVEEGGMLIIDGGKITDIEDNGWKGIVVDGDASKTQWPIAVNGPQGVVRLYDDAIIENALKGISAPNGGVVQATEAQFLNNDIDVEFGIYTNKYPSNAGAYANLPAPNVSYFTDCDFITDQALHSGNQPSGHLILRWVDGIRVNYSRFENQLPANLNSSIINRGIGILCQDATVKVSGKCLMIPPLGSPCTVFQESEFKGLAYGIHASSAEPQHYIEVTNSMFDDNWRGIYINGMDNCTVKSSEFNIEDAMGDTYPFHPYEYNYGIYIRGSRGFEIEENDLKTQSNADFGIYSAYTNTGLNSSEEIYGNKFEKMTYAVFAQGRNDGLLVSCNDFDQTKTASITVSGPNGRIATPQGTCTSVSTPAGNAFDNIPCSQSGYDLLNGSGSYMVLYNHHSSPATYVPNCDWNVNTYTCPSLVYNTTTSCPSRVRLHFAADLMSEVNELKADENEMVGRIVIGNGGIATGNSSYLMGEIQNQGNGTSLMASLDSASPYLSEAILTELVTHSNPRAVLSSSQITSVLIDNSPLSTDVMSAVNSMNPSLDADDLSDLTSAQVGVSERSVLEESILSDTRGMELLSNRIIRTYHAIDSLSGSPIIPGDSIYDFLNGIHNDLSDIHSDVQVQMAYTKLAAGDLTNANTLLTAFENSTNNNNQSAILKMVITQRQNGSDIYSVTGSDLTTLQTLAADSTKHGHTTALGILAQIDEDIYSEEFILVQTGNKLAEETALGTEEARSSEENNFHLFPNPNDGSFNLVYASEPTDNLSLEIYDLKGVLVYFRALPADQNQISLNQTGLENGLFVYRILNSGMAVHSGKLMINKEQ